MVVVSANQKTPASTQQALASAIDELEIDVRPTSDAKAVLGHNPTYLAGKKIHRYAKRTFQQTRADGKSSLNDALKLFTHQGRGKILNIDLKLPGCEDDVVKLIKKYHLERRTRVLSWSEYALRRVHEIDPQLKLGLSFAPKLESQSLTGIPYRPSPLLPRRHPDARAPARRRLPLSAPRQCLKNLIRRLHAREFRVIVVNADTLRAGERLARLGVFGAMTNDAPTLLKHFKQ